MREKTTVTLALLSALSLLAPCAHSDDDLNPSDEHVRVSLGAMHVSSTTTLQADSSAGATGSVIDGEHVFGLDGSDFEPMFQAVVRAGTRQRLSFDYFTLDRNGNSTVGANPIVFRNVTFNPGDPLQTQLNIRTFGINYEYSFWRSETLEIAAMLGVHITDLSTLAKVQTASRHVLQTDDQAGPVPTVGLDATWVVSRRFYLDVRAQYLDVHADNVAGSLGFYEFDALYRYRRNVSLGLGYTQIKASLTSDQGAQGGEFDFNTRGPELFVRVAF